MDTTNETFDLFADDEDSVSGTTASTNQKRESQDAIAMVEAVQVVRMVKGTVSQTRREIIDTFVVSYPKMTYERALKLAHTKARILGNCVVIEKLERIVGGY